MMSLEFSTKKETVLDTFLRLATRRNVPPDQRQRQVGRMKPKEPTSLLITAKSGLADGTPLSPPVGS